LRAPEKDLTELSEADLEVLAETWRRFGRMSGLQLRRYTHRHCQEWKDPEGSMIPMQPEDLFTALKFTPKQTKQALARLREADEVEAAFAAVRD